MVERVSAIIRLADETPPQFRPRVVRAVDAPGLEVEWRPTAPDFHHNQTGFPFDGLRRRMRDALDDPDREILIEVHHGKPRSAPSGPLAPLEARMFGNQIQLATPLSTAHGWSSGPIPTATALSACSVSRCGWGWSA